MPVSPFSLLAVKKLVQVAFTQASEILKFDSVYSPEFTEAKSLGKPIYDHNEYKVTFASTKYIFTVSLDWCGTLLEISIQ